MEGVLSTNDDGDLDYTHYDEDRGSYSSADVTRERPPEADPGQSRTILQQVNRDIWILITELMSLMSSMKF